MQRLIALCDDAKSYPRNIGQRGPLVNVADLYERLDRHAACLFSSEDDSSLDVLELKCDDKGIHLPILRLLWILPALQF